MTLTEPTTTTTITVDAANLRRILSNGLIAAGSDRARPVLNAVLLHSDGTDLESVATDSYMLVRSRCAAVLTGAVEILVDRDEATAIVALLKGMKGSYPEVSLTVTRAAYAGELTIHAGNATATYPLTEDVFPNYLALIPKGDPLAIPELALNLNMLARIAKLDSTTSSDKPKDACRKITWLFNDPNKVQRFTLGTDVDGLLMPVG